MRVLWFSNTPALGIEYLNRGKVKGSGGWLYSLNKFLKDRVELAVAFSYPYDIKPFQYENTKYYPIYSGNIILNNLKSRYLNWIPNQDFKQKYLDIIEDFKPNIIHIHGTENPFGCISDSTPIPIVTSIQGNITVLQYKFFDGIPKEYLNVPTINAKSVVSLILNNWTSKGGYKRFCKLQKIEEQNIKTIHNFIGRTDWDKDIVSIQSPNSKYYHNDEVLRDEFYKQQWTQPKNKTIKIHTTTGDAYYKGFETLCYALTLLQRAGYDVQWNVAGISGNDAFLRIIRKLLNENYPKNGLNLLGSITADKLIDSMKECDLYVMPSHIENSPNSLCEAMMFGMPCIATCAGGTSSLLTNNEDGILIQNHDPWSMAGAILRLWKNPELAAQYGQKARQRALQRHDKNKIVTDLLNIYDSIIRDNNENTDNITK